MLHQITGLVPGIALKCPEIGTTDWYLSKLSLIGVFWFENTRDQRATTPKGQIARKTAVAPLLFSHIFASLESSGQKDELQTAE